MLNEGELEKLAAGTWQLDCQRITLRPRSPDVQTVNAPGWIKHDEDGNLRFKLLGAGGFDFPHQTIGTTALGQITEHLYAMEALDEFGRVWNSERAFVDSIGSSVEGSLFWIASEQNTTNSDHLRLILAKARALGRDCSDILGELSAIVLHLHAHTKGLDEIIDAVASE